MAPGAQHPAPDAPGEAELVGAGLPRRAQRADAHVTDGTATATQAARGWPAGKDPARVYLGTAIHL